MPVDRLYHLCWCVVAPSIDFTSSFVPPIGVTCVVAACFRRSILPSLLVRVCSVNRLYLCSWCLSVFPLSVAMAARGGGSRSPRRRQSSDDAAALVEPPPSPVPTVLELSSSDDEERPAPQAAGEGVGVAARQAYREGDSLSPPRRPGERPIDHFLCFNWDWWMPVCDHQILAEYGVVISPQELHQGPLGGGGRDPRA